MIWHDITTMMLWAPSLVGYLGGHSSLSRLNFRNESWHSKPPPNHLLIGWWRWSLSKISWWDMRFSVLILDCLLDGVSCLVSRFQTWLQIWQDLVTNLESSTASSFHLPLGLRHAYQAGWTIEMIGLNLRLVIKDGWNIPALYEGFKQENHLEMVDFPAIHD